MTKGKPLVLVAAILITAAVVAVAALAPLLLFKVQDAELLGTPHAYPHTAGSLDFLPQELPVVRALYNVEEAQVTGNYTDQTYLSVQSTQHRQTLLSRVEGYIESFVAAGVIQQEIQEYLAYRVFPSRDLNFTHSVDSRGMEYITCHFGLGAESVHYITFTVVMSLDVVVYAEFFMPAETPFIASRANKMLSNYLAYLGIDIAGDWRDVVDPRDQYYYDDAAYTSVLAHQYSGQLRIDAFLLQSTFDQTHQLQFMVNSVHLQDEGWLEANYPQGESLIAQAPVPSTSG